MSIVNLTSDWDPTDKDAHLCGFSSLEELLNSYIPKDKLPEVLRVLHGHNCGQPIESTKSQFPDLIKFSKNENIDFTAQKFIAEKRDTNSEKIVKICLIQNSIKSKTTEPISHQRQKIIEYVGKLVEVIGEAGVNILCLQEAWSMPFAFCTREKDWAEFAEPIETSESIKFCQEKAKKYNMVIISPIIERDTIHGDIIWNTAVIIGNRGNIIGKHRKNHIPRVGDFNESTYYMEGNTGHPVFETDYGRIGVNICYGRHHPLNWMAFGLNGAQIVFNPSATVGALSEPLWPIEARNASIANGYYVGAINRVGKEIYPNEFTSGDKRPAHKDFGFFYGSSYVAAPDGSRSYSLARNKDGILIAECDLNLCRQVKDKWGFQMTARYELYADLLNKYIRDDFQPQIIKDKGNDKLSNN